MDVRGKSVYVGLSGGVDSAVSAALLARAGARVTGVFILGWYPIGMPCTWAEDRRDAMRVAAHLGIQFKTFNASEVYKSSVIEYLLREYKNGRTPNPDVMCNRDVKFGAFHAFAKAEGADYIATGHYLAGEKDQRYFLWAVPKHIWSDVLFPVGRLTKEKVRALARSYGLPVAEKHDSQGVCFLGPVSVEDFLSNELSPVPGKAVDTEGRVVGAHKGAVLYTLGERVALTGGPEKGPWFVRSKDLQRNEITVATSPLPPKRDQHEEVPFSERNMLLDVAKVDRAQTRYRGPMILGKIAGDKFVSTDELPEYAAPGQSIVFYSGDELAGGGIIV